jgi:hypothetical protein
MRAVGAGDTTRPVLRGRPEGIAMEFSIPEEITRLCDGVRRFMDEEIYPREGRIHWKHVGLGIGSDGFCALPAPEPVRLARSRA